MRGFLLILCFLMVLAAAGCQTSPAARREIALLKAEIIDLEDQYYRIKSEFRAATGREPNVRQAFNSRGTILSETELPLGDEACDELIIESDGVSPGYRSPQEQWNQLPQSDQERLRQLEQSPEEIELEPSPVPNGQSNPPHIPAAERWQQRNRQSQLPGSGPGQFRNPAQPGSPDPIRQVDFQTPLSEQASLLDSVNIASDISGGFDRDGQTGDDGIYVFIQPLDQNGHAIQAGGSVWVSLVDPAAPGGGQRVGFWKLTPAEVSAAIASFSDERPGAEFYLPWSHGIPPHESLQLFVRWIDESGQQFESQLPVRIKGRGQETLEQENAQWRPNR